MYILYEDLNDDDLKWIVVTKGQQGNWKKTIDEAATSLEINLGSDTLRGEDPHVQDNIRCRAKGNSVEELKLEVLLNE